MRIFLTGATGYVGSAVLDALVRAGHEVTALVRSGAKASWVAKRGGHAVVGDLATPSSYLDGAQGHQAYVHTALDAAPRTADTDRLAIETLVGCATSGRSGADSKVFVYTSGVWVLGECKTPASEAEPIVRPAAAVAWRPSHEKRVLEAATDRIATAVVRPGIVFGEKRGLVVPWFESAVKDGRAAFAGTGDQRWALVHRTDLAELYRLVLERRARGIFHGVDGASPTVAEAAAAASRAAGKGGAVRAIPLEEARKAMGPMADALAMDQVVVSARGAELGWAPKHAPFLADAPNAFREWRA